MNDNRKLQVEIFPLLLLAEFYCYVDRLYWCRWSETRTDLASPSLADMVQLRTEETTRSDTAGLCDRRCCAPCINTFTYLLIYLRRSVHSSWLVVIAD